ncbi:MAG: hypothetical protein ACOCRX_10385 [Candidatus Woesearchaeota archaeon]
MGEQQKVKINCPYPCGESLILKIKTQIGNKTKKVMCPYCNNEFYLEFKDGELEGISKIGKAYFHTQSIVRT